MGGIHGRGGASTYHVHVETQRCKLPADKFTYSTAYAINEELTAGLRPLQIFETRPNDHRGSKRGSNPTRPIISRDCSLRLFTKTNRWRRGWECGGLNGCGAMELDMGVEGGSKNKTLVVSYKTLNTTQPSQKQLLE